MGTRSLVDVIDEDGKVLVTIYRQYDGYPEGMGEDLQEAVGGTTIINGFNGQTAPKYANTIRCLAAQLVGTLKAGEIGNVYLHPPGTVNVGEEYHYLVRADGNGVKIEGYEVDWETCELGKQVL